MGGLQSRIIGEIVAPVAQLSGIPLSPEDTFRYGRHRRKTVILLWSPSLLLLVIGSTPPSSSFRFRPVAQLLPMLFHVTSPHYALLWVPVPFWSAGLRCCFGLRCRWASLLGYRTYRLCPSQGMHLYWCGSSWSTFFPLARHTPTKCWLGYRSPARDDGFPFAWSISPFYYGNRMWCWAMTLSCWLMCPSPAVAE